MITVLVTGMTCQHCADKVTSELTKIAGVTGVDVKLPSGQVDISTSADANITIDAIQQSVEDAGFQLAD